MKCIIVFYLLPRILGPNISSFLRADNSCRVHTYTYIADENCSSLWGRGPRLMYGYRPAYNDYRTAPPKALTHQMHTSFVIAPPTSTMDSTTNKSPMELALDDLKAQKKPNYAATAKRHFVDCTTSLRRHKGQTVSRATVNSELHQRLTFQQEEISIT